MRVTRDFTYSYFSAPRSGLPESPRPMAPDLSRGGPMPIEHDAAAHTLKVFGPVKAGFCEAEQK